MRYRVIIKNIQSRVRQKILVVVNLKFRGEKYTNTERNEIEPFHKDVIYIGNSFCCRCYMKDVGMVRPIPDTGIDDCLEPDRHAILRRGLKCNGLEAGPSLTCPNLKITYIAIMLET
jgi:hypothetical protein